MASTNVTTNYSLSQFIGTDKPAWLTDYNGDMLKIDTQMKLNADAAAAAQSDATALNTQINDPSTGLAAELNTLNTQINDPGTGLAGDVAANALAISGVNSKLINKYAFIEEVVISHATSDTIENKLKAIASGCESAFAALGADEILVLSSGHGSVMVAPTSGNKIFTNASSAFDEILVGFLPSTSKIELYQYRISSTPTAVASEITTNPNVTITDLLSSTTAANYNVKFLKYKKLATS